MVATRSMESENVSVAQRQNKVAAHGGGKRRALGDIGNINAPTAGAKENAEKEKARRKSEVAQLAPSGLPEPVLQQIADAPVRITRSKTRALAQGVSLSTLLQARSATATNSRRSGSLPPPSPLPDIDGPDKHNHLVECQYVNDVYAYFRRIEPKFRAPANYMDKQLDINEKMRAILIDWLVEVHLKFKLMPESLFLTINLIDRYLAVRQVTRKNLQLVGVTAMLVAAKYEEIWAPEVRDFVYISDKAYTRKQILDTERDMLKALDYNLSLPTSYQFLARLLKAANVHYDKNLALFVAYCAELCLVDHNMLRYSYSELAAAIMYVAMKAFKKQDPYPYNLMRHAAHTKESVLHISKEIVKLVQGAHSSNLQAVVKKYSNTKFCEAAMVAPPLDILDE